MDQVCVLCGVLLTPAYAYVSYSKQNASYPNAEIWNINMTHGMVLLVHVVNYVAQHSPPTAHSPYSDSSNFRATRYRKTTLNCPLTGGFRKHQAWIRP